MFWSLSFPESNCPVAALLFADGRLCFLRMEKEPTRPALNKLHRQSLDRVWAGFWSKKAAFPFFVSFYLLDPFLIFPGPTLLYSPFAHPHSSPFLKPPLNRQWGILWKTRQVVGLGKGGEMVLALGTGRITAVQPWKELCFLLWLGSGELVKECLAPPSGTELWLRSLWERRGETSSLAFTGALAIAQFTTIQTSGRMNAEIQLNKIVTTQLNRTEMCSLFFGAELCHAHQLSTKNGNHDRKARALLSHSDASLKWSHWGILVLTPAVPEKHYFLSSRNPSGVKKMMTWEKPGWGQMCKYD